MSVINGTITDPTDFSNCSWISRNSIVDPNGAWPSRGDFNPAVIAKAGSALTKNPNTGAVRGFSTTSFAYETNITPDTDDFLLGGMWDVLDFSSPSTLIGKFVTSSARRSWQLAFPGGGSTYLAFQGGSDGVSTGLSRLSPDETPTGPVYFVVLKVGTAITIWWSGSKRNGVTISGTITSALFDSTDPICFGGRSGSASTPAVSPPNAEFLEHVLIRGTKTTADAEMLCDWLADQMPVCLPWGQNALTGPYETSEQVVINSTVTAPNGNTPTFADIESNRYHHHVRIAQHPTSFDIWEAYSVSGSNEDAPGQFVAVKRTDNLGVSWYAAQVACPPQSTFDPVGASYTSGSRFCYPRAFVINNGLLYIVTAVMQDNVGLALLACECKADGTLGTLVRVSPSSYAPLTGIPAVPADSALTSALFTRANVYGTWGGSFPGYTASDFVQWIMYDGINLTEPATCSYDGSSANLIRMWRRVGNDDFKVWQQTSNDSGATWSRPWRSRIPNSSSSVAIVRRQDGSFALVGNAANFGIAIRNPLYLAIFDAARTFKSVKGVRYDYANTPSYSGTFKGPGVAYPGIFETRDGQLAIGFSLQKERIGFVLVSSSPVALSEMYRRMTTIEGKTRNLPALPASTTDTQTAKLAADGLDVVAVAAPANRAAANTFPKLLMYAVRTMINTLARNKASGAETLYADDDVTPLYTRNSTDDGAVQRRTKSS